MSGCDHDFAHGFGFGGGFAFIVVLFILLIIVWMPLFLRRMCALDYGNGGFC